MLHGPVADQAALHGVIDLVNALGLELIEVRRLPGDTGNRTRSRHGE